MPPQSPAAVLPMPMPAPVPVPVPSRGVGTVMAGPGGHEFVNANPSRDGRKPQQPGGEPGRER